jgi:hypothetical protein
MKCPFPKIKKFLLGATLSICIWQILCSPAHAGREAVTLPVVFADYYGFAYTQAWRDRSYGFFYPTAGVDALGWTILAAKGKYSGMFLVNFAGLAKTVYPLVILGGKPDREVKRRAWASVGTHAGTLLWLKIWGKPALTVMSWAPSNGSAGARFAFSF